MKELLEYLSRNTKIVSIPKLKPMLAPDAIDNIIKQSDSNIKFINQFYEWDTNFYNFVDYSSNTGLILEVDDDNRELWCIHITNKAKDFEDWATSNRNGRQEFLFDYAVLYKGEKISLEQVSYFVHYAKRICELGCDVKKAKQLLNSYKDFKDFKVIDDDRDYLYISI